MNTKILMVVFLCVTATNTFASDLEAADPFISVSNDDIVISATRLKQSKSDVPASVTVITGEDLVDLGITNVAEAMRLVPGMQVAQASAHDYRIANHGTYGNTPKRMNILVDGISLYRSGFPIIDWLTLPVSIHNIDRIEVVRGPSAVAYGANSFLGVVNIITKHASDSKESKVLLSSGSNDFSELYVNTNFNLGETDVSTSIHREIYDGFDKIDGQFSDERHDGTRSTIFDIKSATKFKNSELNLKLSYIDTKREEEFVVRSQTTNPDIHNEDVYFSGSFTHDFSSTHSAKLSLNMQEVDSRQSWTSCLPRWQFIQDLYHLNRSNPAYVGALLIGQLPSGGTAEDDQLALSVLTQFAILGNDAFGLVCGDANQDFIDGRRELEFQDILIIDDNLRIVTGFGATHSYVDSETYLGGRKTKDTFRLFTNVEYKAFENSVFNVGIMIEDTDEDSPQYSPRLAFNHELSPNQTIRSSYSVSKRIAGLWESKVDWSYQLDNFEEEIEGSTDNRYNFASIVSPGVEKAEKIETIDLAYYLSLPKKGLAFDIRYYQDKLSNLISTDLNFALFDTSNTGTADIQGVEIESSLKFSRDLNLRFNYSYQDLEANNPFEKQLDATHQVSSYLKYRMDNDLQTSLAVYYSDEVGPARQRYLRYDLNVQKAFSLPDYSTIRLRFGAKYHEEMPEQYWFTETNGKNSLPTGFTNKFQLRFSAAYIF